MARGGFSWLLHWLVCAFALLLAAPSQAHPAPFSYLDVHLGKGGIHGTLTVHVIDVAHELHVSPSDRLLDPEGLDPYRPAIAAMLAGGLSLRTDRPLTPEWTEIVPIPEKQQLKLSFRVPADQAAIRAGALTVHPDLFRYDRLHQSFVNIYEDGTLRQQWIFNRGSAERTFYLGTTAGAFAVVRTFVPAGIHHILIGPDHLLFLLGLLLLGGSWKTLLKIVTAFTLGHSVTLSLAALNLVTPPPSIIEPGIALTIVVVGADNLLRGKGRDNRAWMALAFGLIHGFGFANVLREFGLPTEALVTSLFSFNVGVELGQLCVVVPVALIVDFIWRRSPKWGYRVAVAGSTVVIAAGAYWFVQRVFFPGGLS